MTSTVGVKVGRPIAGVGGVSYIPEVKLAWGHDWRDDSLSTQAMLFSTPFALATAAPGEDAALVGLTLTALGGETLRAFIGYDADLRRNGQAHQFSLGLRKQM